MSRDVCAKTKCAPKIYRKLSDQQKLVSRYVTALFAPRLKSIWFNSASPFVKVLEYAKRLNPPKAADCT
jgi:hypothetical protein